MNQALSISDPLALDLELPWQEDEEKERALIKRTAFALVPLLLLFIVLDYLPVFEQEYEEPEVELVRTKVIMEPIVIEEPPAPVVTPPKPTPPPKQEVVKPKTKKPTPKKNAVAKKTTNTPPKVVAPPKADAPPKKTKSDLAASLGFGKVAKSGAASRSKVDIAALQNRNLNVNTEGAARAGRKTVFGGSSAGQTSGGIAVNDANMKGQGGGIRGYQAGAVDGFVEGGIPVGDGDDFYDNLQGQRSAESIRRLLEREKSKAFTAYARALRQKPNLAGKFVFKMTIQPDGRVTGLKKAASDLGVASLEQKILAGIRRLNFGREDVAPRDIEYTFVFVPPNA